MYNSLTEKELKQKFAEIKAQEEKLGVKINFDISDIRDKDHLDCLWYGGEVGSIEYKGYKIVIGAYGDICITGVVNGEDFYFKDKNNSGAAFCEFGSKLNDEKIYKLFESKDKQNYLEFGNNNWFEVDLVDPDGNFVDLCNWDNVIDINILDCFANVEDYFKYVHYDIAEKMDIPESKERYDIYLCLPYGDFLKASTHDYCDVEKIKKYEAIISGEDVEKFRVKTVNEYL